MKKLIAKIEDMNFSGREYFLLGVCLLLGGTLECCFHRRGKE